jgi:copper homeostasis protein
VPLLEVIACSAEDAVEAEQGGAGRLEIISRFDRGGLTPSLDLVSEIKSRVSIPMRVMLRENDGYMLRSNDEKNSLIATARRLEECGADGAVLGFLKDDYEIDLDLTAKILEACPNLRATFHHAFEETADKLTAIEAVKSLPQIDRILSHAGPGNWAEKYGKADLYARTARPEIQIVAGGGIDASAIRMLRKTTTITEFHVGTAARTEGRVDRKKVRELVASIEE